MFAVTSPALAQTAPPEPAAAPAAALEDTGCVSQDAQRANELFSQATTAWEQGDTAGAVAALREAYTVSKCSAFLFVLGEMLRQSNNECEALGWYERYIVDNPAIEKRAVATERIAELRSRCAATPPAEEPAPSKVVSAAPSYSAKAVPPTREPRYWTTARIGGVASLGVSVLLGTGAVYFAVRAHNASNDYEQLWRSVVQTPTHGDAWQRQRSELEQRGSSVTRAPAT